MTARLPAASWPTGRSRGRVHADVEVTLDLICLAYQGELINPKACIARPLRSAATHFRRLRVSNPHNSQIMWQFCIIGCRACDLLLMTRSQVAGRRHR